PVTISDMDRPLLGGTRRDFLTRACAFLLLQSRRKSRSPAPPSVVSPIRFREVAGQAGLNFVLQNNPTPRKHMIETMPGGVAAFDYNSDGLTEIFFTNGAALPSPEKNAPQSSIRFSGMNAGLKLTNETPKLAAAGSGT